MPYIYIQPINTDHTQWIEELEKNVYRVFGYHFAFFVKHFHGDETIQIGFHVGVGFPFVEADIDLFFGLGSAKLSEDGVFG